LPNGVADNNPSNDSYTLNNITINNPPTANAGTDQTIIAGQNVTLTATGGGTYQWSSGDNTASTTISPAATTIYTVTVTSGNCSSTASVTVNVNTANIWSAGAHNNNWNNPSNWSGNVLPNSNMDVNIPSNPTGGSFFPTVNVLSASCKNLTITTGGSLNVLSGNTLTIYGDITNNGSSNMGQGTYVFCRHINAKSEWNKYI